MTAMVDRELRCPNTGNLFGIIKSTETTPIRVDPDNLLEVSCYKCRRQLRLNGRVVKLVFHRFNFLGQLVESEEELLTGERRPL